MQKVSSSTLLDVIVLRLLNFILNRFHQINNNVPTKLLYNQRVGVLKF